MGTRKIQITPEVLIDFLKDHRGDKRVYTINDPLPDDTQISTIWLGGRRSAFALDIILELKSAEWPDDGEEYVQPSITTHYLEEGK